MENTHMTTSYAARTEKPCFILVHLGCLIENTRMLRKLKKSKMHACRLVREKNYV